ncbi:glycoside hydrolase family 3 C-terminal domain-containing protein [Timonella senegalensis]|uniref:glycoside hydrolase family 3 C-terminal domain-containing protein n=1 Tax=Timonella senegalensis TaxID=1465825 RepID=UPI002FDD25A9
MSNSPTTSDALASLSHFEKVALLSGKNTWQTREVPRLGVRALFMADGPHGVRKQMGPSDHLGINESAPSTCFPTAATVANSWDPTLGRKVAEALGREAAHIGVDVLLGPGMNIKRSPLCGRNFEYFSEDPYLTGKFGASYVNGIQSAGIAASPKHFAVNSQETRRMTSNSVVDEQTLREIYLTSFEMMVREAAPKTIMSSYNLINGTYAHENGHLLQDILRDEWGFDGMVVTDWGGGNDPAAAIEAGGAIEMPSPGFNSVQELMDAKNLNKEKLDARVAEVLNLVKRVNPITADDDIYTAHHVLAQEVAEQSIVLLKNENNILPLAADTRVAIIGAFAFTPRYQGAGSSLVNPTQLATPVEALDRSGLNIVAKEQGFRHGEELAAQEKQAALSAAGSADVVVMYLGLDDNAESEGKDRDHLRIPENQIELLKAVKKVNSNIVVVLAGGSAVEMPWIDDASAIIHGYLGGQAGAPAMVRVLTGEINPSGRLAETYPLSLNDTPTAGRFPATEQDSFYLEGPYVGYRYYETAGVPVQFPFGYGLSYTTFAYSDLQIDAKGVRVTVTNTGDCAGREVVQMYVGAQKREIQVGLAPESELKGFAKVELAAGESKTVEIIFDEYSFRRFDVTSQAWSGARGAHVVSIRKNSHDVILSGLLSAEDVAAAAPAGASAPVGASAPGGEAVHPAWEIEAYRSGRIHGVSNSSFSVLMGREVTARSASVELHANSPLSDLKHAKSPLGRMVSKYYLEAGLRRADRKGKPDLNLLFQYGMPFRAIAKMSGGLADQKVVDGILLMMNGHFFKGLGATVRGFFSNKSRQRALGRTYEGLSTGTATSGSTDNDSAKAN